MGLYKVVSSKYYVLSIKKKSNQKLKICGSIIFENHVAICECSLVAPEQICKYANLSGQEISASLPRKNFADIV